jgi:glutamate synthase (NADPH) small chain
VHVGRGLSVAEVRNGHDAILLAMGAGAPRDLAVPGRELGGIHFAMEYLTQQNRRCAGDRIDSRGSILATGKRVVIIGGGDTGADCLGTAHRQKPLSVLQLEIMPLPPAERSPQTPWPLWPVMLRTESAHEEGGTREWGVSTIAFEGNGQGWVAGLRAVRVGPPPRFEPMPGTEMALEADLVLLAAGFAGPVREGMIESLGLGLDPRGNIAADSDCMTSVPGVFAAGDSRQGQSLVVRAIADGRRAALGIHRYLNR